MGLAMRPVFRSADIFALKSGGMGWGNIKKALRNGMITPTPPVTETVTAEPGNGNKPVDPGKPDKPDKTKVPKTKPKNNGNSAYAVCPAPGTNPTAVSLANRSGVSYSQIMNWYCQGMNWKQIEHRLGLNIKKTPRP